ncbi:MAG TPA: HlyD family secretion protein [Steroidobacteraceae bacterium]|nr:HlyD family secretion protein [Steroidobacteraceae bacterium]
MAQSAEAAAPVPDTWLGRHRRLLLLGGPVLLALVGAIVYLTGGRYASTDDAYLQAARVEISCNVAGRVVQIAVHDNQPVHAGDLLFQIDPQPFQIAIEDAEARLAGARLQVQALEAAYHQRQADERAARTTIGYRQDDYDRKKKLAADGITSRAQLDQATHDLDVARQALIAATQQTASALAQLGGDTEAPIDSRPAVREAQAALDRARLNLSYTTVRAPLEGIVTKVEQLQIGDYINAVVPVFALVARKDMWVEANFKETDLEHMRPGQKATFTVDAFPGTTFHGKVESTSPGTGASFSLLPPENSSGNWVKVVQRLPVRLSIDPGQADLPLAAGMSVVARVDTQHHRSLAFWK